MIFEPEHCSVEGCGRVSTSRVYLRPIYWPLCWKHITEVQASPNAYEVNETQATDFDEVRNIQTTLIQRRLRRIWE